MAWSDQHRQTPLDIQWQMKDQENQHSISCIPRSWRCRWQRIRRERKTKETDYSTKKQIGLSSTDTPSAYIHVHLVCWTWREIRVTDQREGKPLLNIGQVHYLPTEFDANKNANYIRTRPISTLLEETSLVNHGFISPTRRRVNFLCLFVCLFFF